MDALEHLISTAEPAFACDREGSIVAWNESAERLLGHAASDVIGKHCYEVLDETDFFGNRFCDARCAIRNMVHRHEPVHHCQLSFCTAAPSRIDVPVSVFVVFLVLPVWITSSCTCWSLWKIATTSPNQRSQTDPNDSIRLTNPRKPTPRKRN